LEINSSLLGSWEVSGSLLLSFHEYWTPLNLPLSSALRIGSSFSSLEVTSLMGG